MDIARSIARWILAFVIGLAASAWIFLGTFNLTLGSRDIAKHWLESSGIYNKALASALQVSPETTDDSSIITPDILKQALSQTFDASYLSESTNSVIDATYDWLEGKTEAITFSIPVQQKAEVFRANLAALITPALDALPKCAGRVADTTKLTCLPAGVSAPEYATQLTKPSSSNTFLSEPISEKTFAGALPHLSWLPATFGWARLSFWALPLGILVLGVLYVFVSQRRLDGVAKLGRQLGGNALVAFVIGLVLWFGSGALDLSTAVEGNDPQQTAIIAGLVNPLVKTILPDIGRALTLLSSAVIAVGGGMWLTSFLLQRNRTGKNDTLTLPAQPQAHPPAPAPLAGREPTTPKPPTLPKPKPPQKPLSL